MCDTVEGPTEMWWKGIFICVIELGNSDELPLTRALRFPFTGSSSQGRNNSLWSDRMESQSDLILTQKYPKKAKSLTIVSKMQRHCNFNQCLMEDSPKRVYSCTIFSVCQHISLDSSFKLLLIAGLNGLLLFIIFYTRKKQHIHVSTWPIEMQRQQWGADDRYCLVNSRHRLSWLRRTYRTQSSDSQQDDQRLSQSIGLDNYYFKTTG